MHLLNSLHVCCTLEADMHSPVYKRYLRFSEIHSRQIIPVVLGMLVYTLREQRWTTGWRTRWMRGVQRQRNHPALITIMLIRSMLHHYQQQWWNMVPWKVLIFHEASTLALCRGSGLAAWLMDFHRYGQTGTQENGGEDRFIWAVVLSKLYEGHNGPRMNRFVLKLHVQLIWENSLRCEPNLRGLQTCHMSHVQVSLCFSTAEKSTTYMMMMP